MATPCSVLPCDTQKDFTAIAGIGNPSSFSPSCPAGEEHEGADRAARSRRDRSHATPGPAFPAPRRRDAEDQQKIDLLPVPYQGGAPATVAALGTCQILVSTVPLAARYTYPSPLRPLASASTRTELMKDS
jgi:hypothetical protein